MRRVSKCLLLVLFFGLFFFSSSWLFSEASTSGGKWLSAEEEAEILEHLDQVDQLVLTLKGQLETALTELSLSQGELKTLETQLTEALKLQAELRNILIESERSWEEKTKRRTIVSAVFVVAAYISGLISVDGLKNFSEWIRGLFAYDSGHETRAMV